MNEAVSETRVAPDSTQSTPPVARVLTLDGEDAWTRFVTAHPQTNLYHSLLWRDFISSSFGHKPLYLVCERRGVISGVLPLFLVRNALLGSKLLSLPYDLCSGGPVASDPESELALVQQAIAIAHDRGVKYLELRAGSRSAVLDSLSLKRTEPALVSETNLTEDLWSRVAPDHLKAMRKAKNRGIVVTRAETRAEFAEFYEVYLSVFRAFGTPPYGRHYFDLLYDRLHAGGHVQLFMARLDKRCVGGLQLFCWEKNLVSKFAACLPEAVPLRAYAALYSTAIEFGISSGYRRLNWGTSARGQLGLVSFKEGWAARSDTVSSYVLPVRGQAPDVEKYFDSQGRPQRVWRKLPLSCTRLLGHAINRWFC